MADTIEKPPALAGYDEDFFLWTQSQAQALRQAAREGNNAPIDWENVAEEIESLGRSDKREVTSLARQILIHFLKLKFSTRSEARNHWKQEIMTWRDALEDVLDDSPSLRARFSDLVESQWGKALEKAGRELENDGQDTTGLKSAAYLNLVGREAGNVLNPDFFPEPWVGMSSPS